MERGRPPRGCCFGLQGWLALVALLATCASGRVAAEPPWKAPAGADPHAGAVRAPTVERAQRLIERGRAAAAAGDSLSALAYYRDAVAAAPRRDEGYVALGELYLALGEPLRALEALQAGARWTLRGEALWMALHATYRALGDDARALDALRQLRRLEPTSTRCLDALAALSETRGAFLEALAARRSLLALLEPAEPEAAREQRAQVRALEVLLGRADVVRSRTACDGGSPVQRALSRCR